MTYPAIAPPCLDSIPAELIARPQWVNWRLEARPGEDKPTKIPYTPHSGDKAKAGQPDTWDTFAEAVAAYEASQSWTRPYSGIGFQLADDDGLFAGDLDACIDPATGEVAGWASDIIALAGTYAEQSPSGTGLRFFGYGQLPAGRRKEGPREMYDAKRYVTVTGRRFGSAPEGIADCNTVLPALHAKMFPPKPEAAKPRPSRPASPLSVSDSDLLDIANKAANGTKFSALWRGDTSGYGGDDSAADLALCRLLAFYTGDSPSRIASLFSQSELGQREKWNREDYRARTIGTALDGMTEFYSPAGAKITMRGKKTSAGGTPTDTGAADKASRAAEGDADGLPMVETNGRHLRDESTDALDALIKGNAPPAIFVRGGQLARVHVNEKNRAVITGLTVPMLRGHMARCANFVSTSEKRGVVPIAPPKDIVEDILALPQWPGVPPLTGIVTAPVFAHDGRMEAQPGYHAGAKLYYHETCPVPIPDTTPTPQNVTAAKSLIVGELLADFPFADEASRAHAVALLLLPFVRPMIDGPTPLHLIDAPTAGTGKGLLAKVCTLPFTAEGTAAKAPPTEEAEWSKTLTSVFSDGDSHLLLDNVRLINSPSFFAALTATLYKDRLLGTNRTGEFENRLVWLATANNIQGNDEMSRRSIWIRLDAGVEQPENRDGFQHPDLAGWATANRGELIGAALTLGRAWVEAGKPSYGGGEKPLGSFEAWTRVMGGILQNAGIPGFLENRQEQRSRVDTETTSWHGFVESWLDRFGKTLVTTSDLFPLALEWMPERMGDPGKDESNRSQKAKFARLMARHVDKVFAGHKIIQAGKATSGVSKNLMQYQLEATQSRKTGSPGSAGSPVSLPRVVVSKEDNIYSNNIHIGLSGVEDSQHSQDSRFEAEDDDFEVIL